jgi:hypothetical protein
MWGRLVWAKCWLVEASQEWQTATKNDKLTLKSWMPNWTSTSWIASIVDEHWWVPLHRHHTLLAAGAGPVQISACTHERICTCLAPFTTREFPLVHFKSKRFLRILAESVWSSRVHVLKFKRKSIFRYSWIAVLLHWFILFPAICKVSG